MADCRVIFSFREPVARAWSEYGMFRKSCDDHADFTGTVTNAIRWLSDPSGKVLCQSALRQSNNSLRYVRCGMYADLLKDWWRHFPRDQSLVLFLEELTESPQEPLARIWRHLGLEPVPVKKMPHARDGGSLLLPKQGGCCRNFTSL